MEDFTLDINAYLRRIGAERPRERNPESLQKLVRAHLEQVPFEDLELTEEKARPSLEPEALFQKIVTHRRGGYCFELNKLFYLLLRALGYDCHCVGVRCILGRPEPLPVSHRGIVVRFGEERWYCDVGFGGRGPKGILNLDHAGIQEICYERFQVLLEDGQYVIVYLEGENPVRMLKFRDEPYLDVDFEMLNGYYSLNPDSPFRRKRAVYRCTAEGWLGLRGDTYLTFHRGVYLEQEVPRENIKELLETQFGLQVSLCQ